MDAKELLDAGHLSAAIEQLNQELRAHPADSRRRTFLFELLSFAGDYERAARQLEMISHQSATAEVGVQVYRNILAAELSRRRLFSDGLRPVFLFDPPAYTHLHLEAVNRLRENRPAEAKALLERSEEARPPLKGRLEDQPFAEFRDADDLLSPFLEVIVHSNYVWIPFEHIRHLTIAPPKRFRDLLWIPATLESQYGAVGEVFLPVLYAGSSAHGDDQVRLGRMTDWKAGEDGLALGIGQRLFLVDGDERAILEVREVAFEAAERAAEGS
jgi:type VI secretion system protein ImpE